MDKSVKIQGIRSIKGGRVKPALLKAIRTRDNDALLMKTFPGLKTKSGKVHEGLLKNYKLSMELHAQGVTKVATADFNVKSYSSLPAGIKPSYGWLGSRSAPKKTYFGEQYLTYADVSPKP
jgi:polyisoprenoid-binding protein YceI